MATVAADRDDAIFLFESVIRGHNIYKQVWNPRIGEVLGLAREPENSHDRHAVCLNKSDAVVGHVPRQWSRLFYFFLLHDGRISCEVTGNRKLGVGLEVPCIYKFTGPEKTIMKMKEKIGHKTKMETHSQPPLN